MKLEVISRQPTSQAHATPLLFVHGAWHGAWCWDVNFLEFFAKNGFASYALSLRGHGESEGHDRLRWTRIREYVEDVASVAKQMDAAPVVIGHSMGGFVVQKYLENHTVPAAVLLASVPPQGAFRTTLRLAARHPIAFVQANLTLSLLPLVATAGLAQEAFFSKDLAEEKVLAYWSKLQDESFLAYLDMLALDLPRRAPQQAPVLVLAGSEDKIFYAHQFDATARAYNSKAEIFPGVAHDMMLDPQWQSVAERMLAWLILTLNQGQR
jgi:pimeloyl-ACP methyl ester carboxylesterase